MLNADQSQIFSTLQETFGFSTFRENQLEIIQAVLHNKDVFAVMPTGGGKSLCYQLPALLLAGTCIVISPLISLMKDQVDNAKFLGIQAGFINSSQNIEDQTRVMDAFFTGELDLLYLAPERLALSHFAKKLQRGKISFVAVDEAHCISEWGHDFRPDYLQLAHLHELLPGIAVAAFTATATKQVAHDIVARLHLNAPLTIRASFNRPNLSYTVRMRENTGRQILQEIRTQNNQPGIVYRLSRNDVEKTAKMLQKNGIAALPYHAGLDPTERAANQDAFNRDKTQVIVATVAFGMGIDKSNVRFVIHGDLPKNIEGYYQETGRSGRDGESAHCLLLYNRGDMMRLGYFLDQLEDKREREIGWQKLKQMADYAELPICRRKQLLSYFAEELPGDNCGGCDICLQGVEAIDATTQAQMIMSAIHRTGQRFGSGHIIDIVLGAKTKRLLQFGHDKLPTHGVGKGQKKIFWRRLVDAMLSDELLTTDGSQFPVLQLTPAGEKVLYGHKPYTMHMVKEVAEHAARQDTTGQNMHPELFDRLREQRHNLAEEQNVPPYVIFSDRSLHDMCKLLPTTPESLLAVNGVGKVKREQYGKGFLKIISSWLADNPDVKIPENTAAAVPLQPENKQFSETIQKSVALAQEGYSLEIIAEKRGLKPSTIASHLVEWLEDDNTLDIKKLISPQKCILIKEQFILHKTEFLKPVIESLEGQVGYDEAKIVRAAMQQGIF